VSRFWNFVKNLGSEDVELRIDGEIVSDDDAWFYEWFDIAVTTPNAFREALAEHKGKTITVWIDSWGGDVFAAAGMFNALKEHKGKIIVKVDGKAVSAASVVAMAGDEIHMSPVSVMMIHNPWTRAKGEAKDMRQAAAVLDEVKETILNAYQMRTGRSRAEISKLMDNETWMSAKTAIAEGFCDHILYLEASAEPVKNDYALSGLAIQNSAEESMRKFLELHKKQNANNPPEETPANSRVFDIKRRVSVREKQFRR
jgi:ATP-dependent Clp protease protease subunit